MFMQPTKALFPFSTSYLALYDISEISTKLMLTYYQAACDEICGLVAPQNEPIPDFLISENIRSRTIPETCVSSKTVTQFCRVWDFNGVKRVSTAPTFVIVAPNSGTAIQQMRDAVIAFLPYGNVRLVEQRDPHYVGMAYRNGLDDSTEALIDILCDSPRCHLISFSQSGIPATIATSWMFQHKNFKGCEPASLIVVGSPINPQLAPDSLNWMATHTHGDPLFLPVGLSYEGRGRHILPGSIPKLYFEKAPEESRSKMAAQALPAEHIHDTLKRVFREFWLPKEKYIFKGDLINTSTIACDVMTFAGDKDRICPPPQTHFLHRLTPNAAMRIERTEPGVGHYQLVSLDILKRSIAPTVIKAIQAASKTSFPVFAA